MSTAPQKRAVSVAEFLEGELVSQIKHEFVEGVVYAMAGATTTHNRIATNATGVHYGPSGQQSPTSSMAPFA